MIIICLQIAIPLFKCVTVYFVRFPDLGGLLHVRPIRSCCLQQCITVP